MLRRYFIGILIFAAFFGLGFATGCSVGFDAEQPGTFECESDDECVDGFHCVQPEYDSEHKACMNEGFQTTEPCGDEDDDGYGTINPRACDACRENPGSETACSIDCDDSDPERHPGATEVCDGKDNNCSETDGDNGVDEPVTCERDSECDVLSGQHPQDGTIPACQDGECVFEGFNQASPDCSASGASCQDGSWEELPEECR